MKKALFLILLAAVLSAAAQISFDPTRRDVRFNAEVGNGYYGEQDGQIRFKVINRTAGKDVTVYAWLEEPLSMEDLRFKDSVLEWQIYSPQKTNGLSSTGFNSWAPYHGRPVPVLTIDKTYQTGGDVEVLLGTTLRWVPSVQPNGVYNTKIWFEVEEEI
ncbi:MAG: hypothetical protein LBJ25_02960 [Candidatus Margulisbacteria bacterium]|jgi:hypothetical protein|nr:hypothetical protein [Candidatus Margulisiibacteriota bacterium]